MKRKWKIIFGLAVLLLAGGFVLSQALGEIEVEVLQAAPGDIRRSFTEEGVVIPVQERPVYSLYTALLDELLVEEGDRVSEGELLAVLDQSEINYALGELEAQLKSLEGERLQLEDGPGPAELESLELRVKEAEESLDSAQKNYERITILYESEAVSEAEHEQAREAVTKAETYLAQQEKAVKVLHEAYDPPAGRKKVIAARREALLAQKDLLNHRKENHQLKAPIGGVVTGLNIEEGGIAGPQAPLMGLYQPENLEVEAKVLTRDVFELTEGMPVTLRLDLREMERTFPGEITAIAPYAEEGRSPLGLEEERVRVTISPQFPEDLAVGPGYKLDVEFATEELEGKLVVPKAVLFTYQGEDALFIAENGRLSVRRVETGLETRQEIVIREGLQEGDLVVLNPQQSSLEEGARVSPVLVEGGG